MRNVYVKDIVVGMKQKKGLSHQTARKDILKKLMTYKIDKILIINSVQEYFNRAKVLS